MTMMVEQHALVTSAAAVAITVVVASAQHKLLHLQQQVIDLSAQVAALSMQ